MSKLFYTTTEAGLLLGLSPRSLTKYVELGQIKAEKAGRDYIISAEEFERFKNTPRKVGRPSRATATIPANDKFMEDLSGTTWVKPNGEKIGDLDAMLGWKKKKQES